MVLYMLRINFQRISQLQQVLLRQQPIVRRFSLDAQRTQVIGLFKNKPQNAQISGLFLHKPQTGTIPLKTPQATGRILTPPRELGDKPQTIGNILSEEFATKMKKTLVYISSLGYEDFEKYAEYSANVFGYIGATIGVGFMAITISPDPLSILVGIVGGGLSGYLAGPFIIPLIIPLAIFYVFYGNPFCPVITYDEDFFKKKSNGN